MIRTIIVDDEPYASELLASLLKRYCPETEVIQICNSAEAGFTAIQNMKPDLVFLDIEMPHMNGFDLLEKLTPVSFDFIFTTSYDQYAIKAIRISALDYLLKPVDPNELKAAVEKHITRKSRLLPQQLDILLAQLQHPRTLPNRIALPTMEGLQMIPISNILFCTSSSNYTILTLKDNQKLTISRTLKEIAEMLEEHPFLRVHHSYLVNLNEIKKYIRGEGGSLLMSDGSTIDVSRSKKDQLLKQLSGK